jgi:hypothetical protein
MPGTAISADKMSDAIHLFFIAILPPDLLPPITACGVCCLLMCDGLRTVCVAYVSSGMMQPGVRCTVNQGHASARLNCFDVSTGQTIIPSEHELKKREPSVMAHACQDDG